jgi:hypothetical protein
VATVKDESKITLTFYLQLTSMLKTSVAFIIAFHGRLTEQSMTDTVKWFKSTIFSGSDPEEGAIPARKQ